MDEWGFGKKPEPGKVMRKMREAKRENCELWRTNLSKKVVHHEWLDTSWKMILSWS